MATFIPSSSSRSRFERFALAKTQEAESAPIEQLRTLLSRYAIPHESIGHSWSRQRYDGDFGLLAPPVAGPAISLVFVQSSDGNTVIDNPADLGGGPTDTHLLYEGLTRVAANGVIAGASSVGRAAFFSVWHPELVALRALLGLPRHPSQIVISNEGHLDFEALLFNVPDVPVFLLAGEVCRRRCAPALMARPWIQVLPLTHGDFRNAVMKLCDTGLRRLSAIGGRFTASRLVDAGLVQDLYLTTTDRPGGAPGTGWYAGSQPPKAIPLARKQWTHREGGALSFEHLLFTGR